MLNLQQLRQDTPGCLDHIHFNNAGSSLPTKMVMDVVQNFLSDEAIIGGYEAMAKYADKIKQVYQSIAQGINAQPEEIAYLQSATDGWYAAFYSITIKDGDTILCSEAEYGSNFLGLLRRKKEVNFNIEIIPSDEKGQVDVAAMEGMINEKVKLITITHIPTNGGLINPVEAIGKITQAHNIPYLIDACQSVGHLPIDVKKIGCDFLSASGRKYLRAPRGTGFLYVNKNILKKLDPEKIDNWSATWNRLNGYDLEPGAKRFENFERNYALQLGMGAAYDYYNQLDGEACFAHIQELSAYAREQLAGLGSFEVMDIGQVKGGIVTIREPGKDPYQLAKYLSSKKIASSVSAPSGTLIDAKKRGLTELNRISFHYFNTMTEIDHLIAALKNR